jgi:putative Mn2+ efflux pump MntP
VKPSLEFRLPRLYVFIIIMAILFSALNVLILFYGQNLFIYFQAIWSWAGVLLLSMIGSMVIGMFLAYRLVAYREFTPFEKDMMEMRVEVGDLKEMLSGIIERLDAMDAGDVREEKGQEAAAPPDDDGA